MISQYILARTSLAVLSFALLSLTSSSHAHSGSTTSGAWEACDDKSKSTPCEYAGFHGERYIGSCQLISKHMMCVRNQPIQMPADINKPAVGAVDPSLFAKDAVVGEVGTVDCKRSGGTKTTCYRMSMARASADPENSQEESYCPAMIKSDQKMD